MSRRSIGPTLTKKTVRMLSFNQAIPPMQSREQLASMAVPIGVALAHRAASDGYIPLSDILFGKVDDCEMEVQVHCIKVGARLARAYEQISDLRGQYQKSPFIECMWKEVNDAHL